MNDVKKETEHFIADAALKRNKKYCGKKTKDITKKERKYKAFF